jgi:8-oxo-dGTP pyrophosphatase MutT (NUDIX family)
MTCTVAPTHPQKSKPRSRMALVCAPTKDIVENECSCAGVFIIKGESKNPQILLVESRRKNYQFSFPKGKRNRGESTVETAKREMHEETGLVEDDYEIFPENWYIEYRIDTGRPHIVYYMARLKNHHVSLQPIDTKEIISVKWCHPEEIYNMRRGLYLQRRQITTRALRKFNQM